MAVSLYCVLSDISFETLLKAEEWLHFLLFVSFPFIGEDNVTNRSLSLFPAAFVSLVAIDLT